MGSSSKMTRQTEALHHSSLPCVRVGLHAGESSKPRQENLPFATYALVELNGGTNFETFRKSVMCTGQSFIRT